MSTLNSKIILAKNIALDRDYINVLNYTVNQMLELIQSNEHYVNSKDTYSFIRPQNTIFTDFSYQECLQANYIAFQNTDYSGKWFFAWIDDVIYSNNGTCEIKYTIDAWSTWFEFWQPKTCFVQREHVNDDTIGANTIDENLNVGEVVEESFEELFTMGTSGNDYYFAIDGTYNPKTKQDFVGVNKVNGNLFGSWIFLFDAYAGSVGLPNINNFLADVNNDAKIESINNMFILPKSLVDSIGTTEYSKESTFGSYSFKLLNSSDSVVSLPFDVKKTKSFNDYQPKNNKCFVYPYNYLLVSNNIGNQNILKYENFDYDTFLLELELAVSVGVSGRLVPRGYKKVDYNYDESLPLAKYPTCAWSSDAFTNWLTTNAINVGSQIVGLGTGAVTGNVGTVASNIAGLIGNFYSANLLPSIQGGQNTGDVNFSARKNTFFVRHMRCKTEYLKIIDDYFTRFGYAINRVKVPNITGRKTWNYVEIGESEDIGNGSVPTLFMETINSACRKGVTIWHNHANVGNYSLNNEIN